MSSTYCVNCQIATSKTVNIQEVEFINKNLWLDEKKQKGQGAKSTSYFFFPRTVCLLLMWTYFFVSGRPSSVIIMLIKESFIPRDSPLRRNSRLSCSKRAFAQQLSCVLCFFRVPRHYLWITKPMKNTTITYCYSILCFKNYFIIVFSAISFQFSVK